jgi:serine/threonine-protein kinase HipA
VKFNPVKIVQVYYKPQQQKISVGRIALKSRQIFFEYDKNFLARGLQLSPFELPLQQGIIPSKDRTFNGLFGVFNDSLPDGWGRLLLDRKLMKHHLNPALLSPLDRLCCVGSHGMGALTYEPETEASPVISTPDLDEIADEIQAFQDHDTDRFVEDLLVLGGSSAGARPKVLLHLNDEYWIIKFRSSMDSKDIGLIEYAYHLMAIDAGLDVPKAHLFPSKKGNAFFGVKRFDKTPSQSKHMHSISGLLHADHQTPSLDYETIMKATLHLTRDIRECEKQFRRCIFNVFSHNRDDHAKNFSFLMDQEGAWRISPAYDLTFSSGPSGEHCTMIMGEGKNPGTPQLLQLANRFDITKNTALSIIDEVKASVNNWPFFAEQAQMSQHAKQIIHSTIQKILKENM